MSFITLEEKIIQGIPVLLCLPAQSTACPLVFAIPGHGGTKTSLLSLAYRLAERGLACASFDPRYHGDRRQPTLPEAARPELGGIYPPEIGMDNYREFLQVIRQCALDIQVLLGELGSDPRLDVDRAGVTGFSMGGFAAFLALAEIPALRAAVPMMGLPTFTKRWLDLLDECAWTNPAWSAALKAVEDQTRQTSAWVSEFDPAEKLLQAAPRALLVMNGDMDYDQPKSYVLNWYHAMRPAYAACPERLRWNVYPVAHTLSPQMEADAVDWFASHLL